MLFGVGQVVESRVHPVQADLTGDHRGDVDFAFRNGSQRGGELRRVIGEHELHVDLLGDGEERVHGVGLHADPGDHDPAADRCPAQHVVDDALHADGLEYHRGSRGVERRAPGGVDGLPGAHGLGQLASFR